MQVKCFLVLEYLVPNDDFHVVINVRALLMIN